MGSGKICGRTPHLLSLLYCCEAERLCTRRSGCAWASCRAPDRSRFNVGPASSSLLLPVLENELAILALLKPARNVAQLYGLCTNAWDGRPRLVLELCDHGNVREYLKALPHDKVRRRGYVNFEPSEPISLAVSAGWFVGYLVIYC